LRASSTALLGSQRMSMGRKQAPRLKQAHVAMASFWRAMHQSMQACVNT
jgi:hypothetical protein